MAKATAGIRKTGGIHRIFGGKRHVGAPSRTPRPFGISNRNSFHVPLQAGIRTTGGIRTTVGFHEIGWNMPILTSAMKSNHLHHRGQPHCGGLPPDWRPHARMCTTTGICTVVGIHQTRWGN